MHYGIPTISITSLDTKELIKVFIYTIYKLYSALNTIISDKGSVGNEASGRHVTPRH